MPRRQTRLAQQRTEGPRPVRRVACYLRVSTDDQAESGLGIEAQRTQARAMATVKGWPEPVEYVDNGISGLKKPHERPALRALLEAVEVGDIDALIIPALDRLARRVRIILEVVDLLAEEKVTLVSCRESFDTSTPAGEFVMVMFAALAQMERATIAARTRAALAEAHLRDGEVGGKLPYGYVRSATGGIDVDEHAALVIARIFTLKRRGKSLRAIASLLNDVGEPSPLGRLWWASSVREVLLNRAAYKGGKRGDSSVCWPIILHSTAAQAS